MTYFESLHHSPERLECIITSTRDEPAMPLAQRPEDNAAMTPAISSVANSPDITTAPIHQHQQRVPFPRMHSEHSIPGTVTRASRPGTRRNTISNAAGNMSTLSLASAIQLPNRLATLEVYELVYGRGGEGESPAETVERLYETNAGEL